MATPREKVRVFLVQIRDVEAIAEQERQCFLRHCRIAPEQLVWHNVAQEPDLRWDELLAGDVLMIGGAGVHSVTEEYTFTPRLAELTLRWIDAGRPFFGSCWGHQFLGQITGGRVVTDKARSEVGTFDIELTPAGRRDPLLVGVPDRFAVQLGHNDQIEPHAPEVVVLASTPACTCQLIRLGDKPAYGSQFHSEMGMPEMLQRAKVYQGRYLGEDEAAYQAFAAQLRPSPEADGLLDRFLTLYS
jgi:GMP synthase (glutamine-hydrolysing)